MSCRAESRPRRSPKIATTSRRCPSSSRGSRCGSRRGGRTGGRWQVDRATRDHIQKSGYGDYFIHRTGHSIGYEVHGNGVNIDNFETRDSRRITPGVCFSIEPGIYLAGEFGVTVPRGLHKLEELAALVAESVAEPQPA